MPKTVEGTGPGVLYSLRAGERERERAGILGPLLSSMSAGPVLLLFEVHSISGQSTADNNSYGGEEVTGCGDDTDCASVEIV